MMALGGPKTKIWKVNFCLCRNT